VQGVFYRKSAEEAANSLGLAGWVRNLPDGSVEAFACGEKEQIESFAKWCHDGPPGARVESVDVVWREKPEEKDEMDIQPGSRFIVTGSW
jgi:acylphosphatase